MYSSCKEAHIAVNDKIQQINANRQESIRPQYIDIALNEAIDVLLTQKIKAFEETGRYYDDLQVLKTTYRSPLYLLANEGNRGFAFLPANYLHGVSYDASVIYDKFKRYRATESVTTRIYVVNISELFKTIPGYIEDFVIQIGNDTVTFHYPAKIYRKEGLFEYINYMLSILLRKGYNVTYERYNNEYYPESLVFYFNMPQLIVVGDKYTIKLVQFDYECYSGLYEVITSDGVITKVRESRFSGMDLVSDVQRRDMLQTYHNCLNRHIHPICTIESNRILVDMDDTFVITDVAITYLRQPTRFDIVTDTATELPFKTEIINLATQKLLGKLKDEGYQIAINESNSLK